MIVNTGILGVSGYTGQELIRWIKKHPVFKLTHLFSTSLAGNYSDCFPEFSHYNLPEISPFDLSLCSDLDLIFLAVPHTKSMAIVKELVSKYPTIKIVDLSADFRLNDINDFELNYSVEHVIPGLVESAVYGLPEIYKQELSQTKICANPGCYATSIILGMLPLKDILSKDTPITIDAKSGVSGAGKSLKESSLFCEVHDNLSAYSTGTHRHLAEFKQEVGFEHVMFSPHLVPMDRGIESAIYIFNESLSQSELFDLFEKFYQNEPFVNVLSPTTQPSTNLVNHTNYCSIIPKKIGSWIVIFSLLDNLVKGASGQAIQNANIMLGLDETTGLIQ